MSYQLNDLVHLMACLRDSEYGCPWDRAQTYQSIVPFTLEEAYEVADVIERGALDELHVELGDLMFQVIFYARIAEEDERFTLDDVIHTIVSKLLSRHPHVFADGTFESFGKSASASVESIKYTWEAKKAEERVARGQLDLFDDVPAGLPSLTRAQKIQKRATRIGFDWSTIDGVLEKVYEELSELERARSAKHSEAVIEEYGDLLFTIVSLARHLGIDSEQSLRLATKKFESRISQVVRLAESQGIDLTIATDKEKNGLWDQAKSV
jgi:ATP diphosphatase